MIEPVLRGFDHAGQKQGTAWQLGDDDVFVNGVSALADGAEAVESGNADASSEISV